MASFISMASPTPIEPGGDLQVQSEPSLHPRTLSTNIAIELQDTEVANAPPIATTWRETFLNQSPTVISIGIGAYFGVAVRVLLTEFALVLSKRQNELLKLLGVSFFLPNAVGCFVMGYTIRWKPVLRNHYNVLLSGITTGFCGSCTTFASWDLAVAAMYVHGKWMNATLVLFVQVATAFVSFRAGYHAADASLSLLNARMVAFAKPTVDFPRLKLHLQQQVEELQAMKATSATTFHPILVHRMQATEESLVSSRDLCAQLCQEVAAEDHARTKHDIRRWIVIGTVVTVWLWVMPFIGFANYPSSRFLAICMGPFGALLRYYLSLWNATPQYQSFPLFTFIPNVAASVLNCILEIIGSTIAPHGEEAFKWFQFIGEGALIVGFAGSLSTVSTFINEMDLLATQRIAWAYRYVIATIVVSQLVSIFILGLFQIYGNAPLMI